jgi:hypothetical protein
LETFQCEDCGRSLTALEVHQGEVEPSIEQIGFDGGGPTPILSQYRTSVPHPG